MCDNCFDPQALGQLVQEEQEYERTLGADEEWFRADVTVPELQADAALGTLPRLVWVSVGPSLEPLPADHEKDAAFGAQLLVRDAVAQLCRVFFERSEPAPIAVGWEPSITPAILDAASHFGVGTEPLVWVFMTAEESDELSDQLNVCDWRRARRVGVRPHLETVRTRIAQAPLRAAIFIGGTEEQLKDSLALPLALPSFAIGSTGGTAKELLTTQGQRFSGAGQIPVASLSKPKSYLVLMRDLLAQIP